MPNRRPSENPIDWSRVITLAVGGLIALALILIALASLITGQWPWESKDPFEGYTPLPSTQATDTTGEESTAPSTETVMPTTEATETTAATEATEATGATTEPTTETTPTPTTKPSKPKPTDPTTEPTEPTDGSQPTESTKPSGGNNEDIDYDDLTTEPTTAPGTEATQPSTKPSQGTPEIDIPL